MLACDGWRYISILILRMKMRQELRDWNYIVVIALLSIIFGVLIFLRPTIYGQNVPSEVGLIPIIFGLYCFLKSLSTKKIIEELNESNIDFAKYVMCIKCASPFRKQDTNNGRCPKCGGVLENLSGFYERHPEIKKK
jgi:TctA family transporter